MKKTFCILLALLVLLAAAPLVRASIVGKGTCGDNLIWTLDGAGTLTISGTGAMNNYSSSITAPWRESESNAQHIKNVVIQNGVTSIGTHSFCRCTGLMSVTIPDSVTSIGGYAFDSCTGLTKVNISDIAKWCAVQFGEYYTNPLFYAHHLYVNGKEVKKLIIPDSVTSIGNRAFMGCTTLTSVTIPDSVTSIGNHAFAGCTGLTSVTIPDSVTSIGGAAFADCTGLTSVTIPDRVTSIGNAAFEDCTNLKSVTIGDSVTSIGNYVFEGCTELTSVTIGDSVTSIGDNAFQGCTKLTSVTIPDSVTSIGSVAFSGCTGLTSVTIPDSVTSIRGAAFHGCTGLTSVTIGNSVTSIENIAFQGCTKLTSVTIPDGVTSIGDNAFQGCTALTSVTIPVSVTSIGKGAFSGCTGLKDVYYGGDQGLWTTLFSPTSGNEALSGANIHYKWHLTHTWDGGVVTTAATCTTNGVKTYTCTNCGATKNETIPATDHNYGAWTALDDTQHKRVCANDSSHVEKENHSWDDGIISKEPTKDADGEKRFICNKCNAIKTVVIPKINSFTVTYDANGGSGAPANQTTTEGTVLTISSTHPIKSFKLTYNANGGSVTTASKSVDCTFQGWNTKKDGSGTSYAPGESYTKDANLTLYAQWTNPEAGTLATASRSGYTFDGWFTAASGGNKITDTSMISSDTTLYAHWTKATTTEQFTWGTDNWNFINSSYTGDFSAGTYRSQIDIDYLRVLASNLTNEEYQVIFHGTYYSYSWLDELFTGSCYGMSSTTLLAKEGLLPYSQYKYGANRLNQLDKPTTSRKVSSLITYYQMLQVKDVIQQQYRSVPYRTNETNIKELLSLLDEHSLVLVGFKKNNWGAHAILAYGYEYGSYTYNGITYQGCIKICDPDASKAYDASYNIYFNTQTYSWAIPAYRTSGISSANGAVFTYVGANEKAINHGGYLSGSSVSRSTDYIARIDASAISDNRSVSKMQRNAGGSYSMMNAAPDDIVEDYSYVLGNESKGTIGYNLKDGDAAYTVTQSDPVEMRLTMGYEDCYFAGSSAAGKSITFDKNGYVEVNGESSEFTISMTFNDDHPTDWFTVQVKGNGSNHASLQKDKEGYVITADDLTKTEVKTNNRTDSAEVQFSTEYKSALIYEVDSTTIGIKVDTDNNGTYETVITTGSTKNALGDVNGDGKVGSDDARLALRTSVKLEKEIVEGTVAFQAADVNKDGKVGSDDARTILRVSVKLESFQ